jgi:hypothetical protein
MKTSAIIYINRVFFLASINTNPNPVCPKYYVLRRDGTKPEKGGYPRGWGQPRGHLCIDGGGALDTGFTMPTLNGACHEADRISPPAQTSSPAVQTHPGNQGRS